jgi:hypothetical protein
MTRNAKATKKKTLLPQVRQVRGSGDYKPENPAAVLSRMDAKIDKIDKALQPKKSTAGGLIGRGLGSLVGQGDLGAVAGDALSKWFGHGDYELKVNSLIKGAGNSAAVPTFSKDGRRGTRIVEREYIADVVSSGTSNTFDVKKYRINPGDGTTFPWLSVVASQYDEYEINGLIFEYRTTSATFNGTTQQLGVVSAMTDYDPTDANPFSKLQMENADYANSTVSCNNLDHGVECDMHERPTKVLYVSMSTPATSDLRFCDLGNFFLATSGVAGTNVTLGELWVSYDVTFYKKQLMGGQLGMNCGYQAFVAVDPTTSNATYPLGTSQYVMGNLGCTYNIVTKTISFPSTMQTGRYMLIAYSTATTQTPDVTFSTKTNCTEPTSSSVPPFFNSSLSGSAYTSCPALSVATNSLAFLIIQITKATASVLLSAGASTLATKNVIYVIQLPCASFDSVTQ